MAGRVRGVAGSEMWRGRCGLVRRVRGVAGSVRQPKVHGAKKFKTGSTS